MTWLIALQKLILAVMLSSFNPLKSASGVIINTSEKLLQDIYKEEKAINNIHRLTSGSQTPEKGFAADANITPGGAVMEPLKTSKRSMKTALNQIFDRLSGMDDETIARYLTDPDTLSAAMQKRAANQRININKNLRQEAEIAASEAGLTADTYDYNKYVNKFMTNWYNENLKGKKIYNPELDDIGFYTKTGAGELRTSAGRDMLPYVNEIIENGKISAPVSKSHKANSNDFDFFRYASAPIEYNGRNMEGVAVLGKTKSPRVPGNSVPSREDINIILNNPNLSSGNYPYVLSKIK
jgi:hypothetical protein